MKLTNILKNNNENNRGYAYRVLKSNIMNLNLKPGELISETSISTFLRLSRTPIREALIRLSDERLIVIEPQKKSMVRKLDLEIINESVFMRETLEIAMLELVSNLKDIKQLVKELEDNLHFQKRVVENNSNLFDLFHLDNEFHKLIYESVNLGRTFKIINQFNTHHSRFRLLEVLENNTVPLIIKQHEEFIRLLKNKDQEGLKKLTSEHLLNFKNTYQDLKAKHPDYFEN